MAAVAAHEITPKHSTQPSFTKRLLQAAQKFEDHASFTTAEWYQQVQLEKPTDVPYATFETYNGTGTISLMFSDASPYRISRGLPGWFEKQVLVKLTLEGQRDIVEGFSKAIRRLPPNMQVEIQDAFETDAFVFFILRMSWEGWVLWTSVVHLDFLGVTLSPPLLLISNDITV
ncbi:hypothetical protein N7541_003068 [Penicillium brevicompactum]|uniref:Uncharacterized protein n=1 Tax=Penicillium brevicompactum TaxID=5074 RepID=A0A9W9RNP0_PENBR|nr:hypothetical protein N7541_003068 [Penicillium brevicompactum]